MQKIIGVMGPGENQATKEDLETAYSVGQTIARMGNALLCGGMSGVMKESARGAYEDDGMTIGICPTKDKADMNEYITVPIVTGLGEARNSMNVLSSDVLIWDHRKNWWNSLGDII